MVRLDVRGADRVAARFLAAAAGDARIGRVVEMHGQQLLARIQSNASGRPGPRVQTGQYRRSWQMERGHSAGGPSVMVGTSAVQANRLEYGFVGADSLGRVYNQPPFPHVGPAVQVTEGPFANDLAAALGDLLGG